VTSPASALVLDFSFPHRWQAQILPSRPAILPARHFVYPRDAEEVERGALEVLVRPEEQNAQPFLATCALGFRDPAVPTGLWSAPNPDELCAISGGYAYLIDTNAPQRFTMIPYRPVLEVRPVLVESEKLSDEGITITAIEDSQLCGAGWQMLTDKETPFTLDLRTGLRLAP